MATVVHLNKDLYNKKDNLYYKSFYKEIDF